jgi:nucleotide-binding universal stress UspA family protein
LAVEGAPTWKAVIKTAKEHDASLIVLGSQRHAGLGGLVAGSVAGDVASHSPWPVLIVRDDGADGHAAREKSSLAGVADGGQDAQQQQ